MVNITGTVADSAGNPAAGYIEFSQVKRFSDGLTLVTGAPALAVVSLGELRTKGGNVFTLPANPSGTLVRVRESLGGLTQEWWTAVPDQPSVEYRALVPVPRPSV